MPAIIGCMMGGFMGHNWAALWCRGKESYLPIHLSAAFVTDSGDLFSENIDKPHFAALPQKSPIPNSVRSFFSIFQVIGPFSYCGREKDFPHAGATTAGPLSPATHSSGECPRNAPDDVIDVRSRRR